MSTGIEVECSVLGSTRAPAASEPGEIVIEADWYDFAAKYEPGGMQLRVPAGICAAARDELRSDGDRGVQPLRLLGLARADFFVEGERVLLNELNTMPGSRDEVYAKLVGGQRAAYGELVERCARWRSSARPRSAPTASSRPGPARAPAR